MDREEAISYLKRKGKINSKEVEVKLNNEEEQEVNNVMKKGKIYGDPIARIQWE